MKLSSSRRWLADLLEGSHPAATDLKRLFRECPKEDQWIEYKSGKELEKADAKREIRKHVTGFANAEGGVLVLGYHHDEPRAIDGAKAPGGGSLSEWATRVCGIPTLPRPRFLAIPTHGVEVLIITVDRSRTLVPVLDDGGMYYIRFGDETKEIPQFLVADVMLGRRAQPELRLRVYRAGKGGVTTGATNPHVLVVPIGLTFAIENASLVFADDLIVGIVSWCPKGTVGQGVTSSMARQLDVTEPERYEPGASAWDLGHVPPRRYPSPGVREGSTLHLGPLSEFTEEWMREWPLAVFPNHSAGFPKSPALRGFPKGSPLHAQRLAEHAKTRAYLRGRVRASAAAYIVGRGFEPWWFQITIEYDSTLVQLTDASLVERINVEPRA